MAKLTKCSTSMICIENEIRAGRLSRRSFCFLGLGILASGAVDPWHLVSSQLGLEIDFGAGFVDIEVLDGDLVPVPRGLVRIPGYSPEYCSMLDDLESEGMVACKIDISGQFG